MILDLKKQIKKIFKEATSQIGLKQDVIIEKPKTSNLGDYAIPCFNYAKILKQNPNEIANNIAKKINDELFDKVEVVSGYINIFLNRNYITKQLLSKINELKNNYGDSKKGTNKKIVLDYSSPNIAKPFSVGHLRSTAIGAALKKIFEKNGYDTIGINYIGDWGTQFGKLICAYKKWGDEEKLKQDSVKYLKELYVRFHEEAEKDALLEDEARLWFKKIEEKNEEALSLWNLFRKLSLESFEQVYKLLGIGEFDSYQGEAFYNDKTKDAIKMLDEKNITEIDEGAKIVRLTDELPPALIEKSDGTTLYMTRDIAAVLYRKKTYDFEKIIYVTGNEQTLHFKQLKKVIEKMGLDWYNDIIHIYFGMVLLDGKRMKTRAGKDFLLEDLLTEAINVAYKYIEEKNPSLENKEKVAKQVGIGAVIFNDLKNYRTYDIDFNLEDIVKFEGETGPYIQYTGVRIKSLLKEKEFKQDYNIGISDYQWIVISRLLEFEEILKRALDNYDPSEIAKYALILASDYNKLYANEKMLSNDKSQDLKLNISNAVLTVLTESLRILGLVIPEKM